jgi:hypothetical protein
MKRPQQDQLLKEILTGDDLSNFRQASLERSLATIRRQHQRQRTARICALAAVPLLLAVEVLLHRSPGIPGQRTVSPVQSTETVSLPTVKTAGVKLITDEELFALFPNRSMALIGNPGRQQLVFLDKPATGRRQ